MFFLKKEFFGGIVAVAKIDSSIEEMKRQYNGSLAEFNLMCDRAKREKLAVRLLLQDLCGDVQISYDEIGKPILSNSMQKVSISHTKDFVAVFLHPFSVVGIDIEYRSTRAAKLRSRFLSAEEMPFCAENIDAYCELCWCAKESVYKMQPDTCIDIFNEIKIIPFEVKKEGTFWVEAIKDSLRQRFEVHYIQNNYFSLTWCLKNK